MTDDDTRKLVTAITALYAFYDREISELHLKFWLEDMSGHPPADIERALVAHRRDPQRGQWLPKPADILRHLKPSHEDAAAGAWAHLLCEIRRVGSYGAPDIDDTTRQAIGVLGGWAALCRGDESQLGFVQRRFTEAYRVASERALRDEALGLAATTHAITQRLQ